MMMLRSGWFVYIGLALVALLLRVLDLGQFVTHDEAEFWLHRSDSFLRALQGGDYAATAITTHPGVTTMWLGSAGIVLRQTLFDWGLLHSDAFPVVLALMRLPAALVHVVGILVGYALLRRMMPGHMATLAALLWAADPFVIGYSRVLHVDALMATFTALSLLAACCYWHHSPRLGVLILSGICAGLAVLSKSPALALLPVIPAIALAAWFFPLSAAPRPAPFVTLPIWGFSVGLTLALVWPAVWADPVRVYELLHIGVAAEGAQPHMTGNFFLGQRQDAPGLLFYPVAIAMRLTPWTLLGVLLLPWAWRHIPHPHYGEPQLDAGRGIQRDLAVLAGFIILFAAALSLFPKKFDRYMVPAFPLLDVLAAVGLVWGMKRLLSKRKQRVAAVGSIALVAIINAAWWHPYSLVAFNQALGGAPAGAQTFTVGWGEGFDQVADWLNQQPDITGVLTVSRMITSLNPYLKEGAQAFFPSQGELRHNAGYVVVYINEVQGGPPMPPSDRFYGSATPLHTVTIHGVDYAWIYQVPPPVEHSRPAVFGEHIHLRGFEQSDTLRHGQPVTLTLTWTTQAQLPTDYWLFAHLIGSDGQRYAQVDMPYPTSTWQPGRYITTQLPLTIPAAARDGTYRLYIGLYEQATAARLPLRTSEEREQSIAGPNALLLTEMVLE